MKLFFIFFLFVSATTLAHAEELHCFAGIQPDPQKNAYVSEKKPQDFTTRATSLIRYGQTYLVRKYQVEIENFIVEGIVYLNSGVAPELSITDRITGASATVQEHNQVRLVMSSPRAAGLIRLSASCAQR